MPNKRVIEAGHLLAMIFVALLLAGANQYLGARPFIAGLLLAAFALPYFAAARIMGERQFLYPAVLLLVLAYHLLLFGMGIAPALQPLFALLPVAVIHTIASQNLPDRPERASQALYGANAVLIGAMALWILFRLPWFYQKAPLATTLALAGYCAYAWFRFRATERVLASLAMVLLGSGAFLFFLYWRPQLALLLATAAGLLLAGLFYRWADRPAAMPACRAGPWRWKTGSAAIATWSAEDLLRAGKTAIHRQHVQEAAIGCDWCHGVIRHQLDRPPAAAAPVIASDKERE